MPKPEQFKPSPEKSEPPKQFLKKPTEHLIRKKKEKPDKEKAAWPEPEELQKVRQEIFGGQEPDEQAKFEQLTAREKHFRQPKQLATEPLNIPAEVKDLIDNVAEACAAKIQKNYKPGFGVFPCDKRSENFYDQVWTRDFSHAAGNYFAQANIPALLDSLKTIFKHQRPDGMLPFRTERTYEILKVLPVLKHVAYPLFNLIEKKIKGREERPVYEGQDFSSAQDTVPATLIAVGEFFINSAEGKTFVKNNFARIKMAANFFQGKADPKDGLITVKNGNADWADSINRAGKLGNINVWWARSLRLMDYMASNLGLTEEARQYKEEFQKVKESLMAKLYNKEDHYFRAEEGHDRLDTVACVFGSLYLLDAEEAVKVQETLKETVKKPSGLQNFYPPYPNSQIMAPIRLIGHGDYHNENVWPWVTCENIQVKIKIALQHPDEQIRNQYKAEAVQDLADMASLFQDAGGAYEIFWADNRKPAVKTMYKPPKNIMGNLAAFQGAYLQLKELGWLENSKIETPKTE